ncbi:MAG TPA: GYD domain-containing protein [Phycisphaerae bacterium]|nr:GYD domain-containing protein [Phycisphaerae bacterium]
MATYLILSKLCAHAVKEPAELRQLAETVARKIKEQCPNIRWKDSYALMGSFDVVDLVEADNPSDVERAAMIIRCHGHATTETMPATPWRDFLAGL